MVEEVQIRVLLCDDQAIVAEALRQMLADCPNLTFHHVTTAVELLAALETFKPTIVLQDLVLEDSSGLAIVKQIRAKKEFQDLPVVVLSTTEDAKVKFDAFASGANDYVVKFPERFELLGRISYHSRAYLNGKLKEQAQKMLAQRSRLESLGTLSAGVAHEINSPLQYIAGNLDYISASLQSLAAHPDQAELVSAVKDCIDGTKRIADIVRAMKAFSHPGKQEIKSCNLAELLRDVSVLSASEWRDVADLDIDCPGTVPPIKCVPGALVQVFLNLVVNAAHATKKMKDGRRGRISIVVNDLQSSTRIEFRDNGCGIKKEIQARIFDPFFTTKDVGEGSGQGLSIARSIIEEGHGGSLAVQSVEGEGTVFTIDLPRVTV